MKKIRNTQLMLRILPFVLTIMLLMSCDSQNTNKSGYKDYQGNLYVDTIVMSDAEQNQVRITLGWNEEIGEITVEEDSAQLPKRIEHYLFHQEDDVLILSTEDQDDIDTCYIRHISNDSIVIIHNNPDVFFTNRNKTILFRRSPSV